MCTMYIKSPKLGKLIYGQYISYHTYFAGAQFEGASEKFLRVKMTPSNLYLYSKHEVLGGQVKNQPEDQWSCKRSPDIVAL